MSNFHASLKYPYRFLTFSDPTLRGLPAFGGIISIAIRTCPPQEDYPIEMCASRRPQSSLFLNTQNLIRDPGTLCVAMHFFITHKANSPILPPQKRKFSRKHRPTFLQFLMVRHLLLNFGGVDNRNKCRYHSYIEGLSDSISPESNL